MNKDQNHLSSNSDELDLSIVFTAISNFFKRILKGIIGFLIFIFRKKIQLLIVFLAGLIIGYLWDNLKQKPFKSTFIVSANYGTANYIYTKVDAIDDKLKNKDTVFLKAVLGEFYENVKRIEIEPIVNIYNFISTSETNPQVFELLSDDQDILEFIKEPVNSMNYPLHKIDFVIKGEKEHESITSLFFKYLNNNTYYNNVRDKSIQNFKTQLDQNELTRSQIDKIVLSLNNTEFKEDNFLLSINEKSQIDELLRTKKNLLMDDLTLENRLANQNEIVGVVDSNYVLEYDRKVSELDKKYLLPILFLGLLLLIYLAKYLVRKAKEFYIS